MELSDSTSVEYEGSKGQGSDLASYGCTIESKSTKDSSHVRCNNGSHCGCLSEQVEWLGDIMEEAYPEGEITYS